MNTNKTPELTMIMPVYNAAQYLEETLGTIKAQNLENMELIAVDDGSTDGSPEILNSFKELIPGMLLIRQENKGPSSARNNALGHARGEYVYFGDADDPLEEGALAAMLQRAHECDADLVIGNYTQFNKYKKRIVENLNEILPCDDIDPFNKRILWTFSLSNKLFRRSLIEKMGLRFPGTSYSEDGVFTMTFVYSCSKISGLDKIVFNYRKELYSEHASITSLVNRSHIDDYLRSHDLIYEQAKKAVKPDLSATYLDEIRRKEVYTLFNNFYRRLWRIDGDTLKYLKTKLDSIIKNLSLRSYGQVLNAFPELPVWGLWESHDEACNSFKVTAILQNDCSCGYGDFIRCLKGLCIQNFVPLKIVVPEEFRQDIENEGLAFKNITYLDEQNSQRFLYRAIDLCDTTYVIVCHSKFVYTNLSVLRLWEAVSMKDADFAVDGIYTGGDDAASNAIFERMKSENFIRPGNGFYSETDLILGNKIFVTDFLKSCIRAYELSGNKAKSAYADTEFVKFIYERASYRMITARSIFMSASDKIYANAFISKGIFETNTSPSKIENPKLSDYKIAGEQTGQKHLYDPKKHAKESMQYRARYAFLKSLPLLREPLIITSDKADNPYSIAVLKKYLVKANVVYQRYDDEGNQDPNSFWKMLKSLLTHRVIICDDYVPLLESFPLKDSQKVIRLLKYPGLPPEKPTYMDASRDIASHVFYNMVSASDVCLISALARRFDIDRRYALPCGCVMTDFFMDRSFVAERMKVLKKKYAISPLRKKIFADLRSAALKDALGNFDKDIQVLDFSGALPEDMIMLSDVGITENFRTILLYAAIDKPCIYIGQSGKWESEFCEKSGILACDVPSAIVLLREILDGKSDTDISYIKNTFISACDGHSAERVARIVNQYNKRA